jgi:NADH dehydrogenase/putative oxidoreductase
MSRLWAAARILSSAVSILETALGPWLDLAVRIWLAQAFLVLQVRAMMVGANAQAPLGPDWWSTFLQQITQSSLGATVQAACPVLLGVGLLSRPAATALLLQVLLLPALGPGPDAQLFWMALLARVLVFGPGSLSLDRLLHRGAESSALPGMATANHFFECVTRRIGPVYQLSLRTWLAAAPTGFALAALSVTPSMQPGVTPWLPHVPSMVASLEPWASLLLASLLAAGAATRPAAIVLLALVPLSQISGTGDVRLYWALLLAVLALHGAGRFSVDHFVELWLRRAKPQQNNAALPHVVVVGGGFGGIAMVRGLRGAACRVTLVDHRNHHLFQPLLYQVATASLSPADIATPVRSMFRDQENVRVLLGEVTGIDLAGRTVVLGAGRIRYDLLVVATGARHSYFGRDQWATFAPGLKSIEDATTIRRRLLLAFEEAENADKEEERAAWLTFVIVGGGPTGVELAGAIAELARHGMAQEFREIDPASARVVLVQSGSRLLPAFAEALSREAEHALRRLGVDVQLESRVEAVGAEGVTISGRFLPGRTVLWAAGVMASPAAAWLGVAADRAGRILVGPDLSVAGCDGVFAIGDTAASVGWAGKEVPGVAPAAKQGGAYVARVIRARLSGRPAPAAFRYRHLGSLATIGRQSAVADFGFVRFSGAIAWWLWGAAHIAFLVGGRNRMTVLVEWLWAYLTYRRGTRLITDAR